MISNNGSPDSYRVPPHPNGNQSNSCSNNQGSFRHRRVLVTHNPLPPSDGNEHPIRPGWRRGKAPAVLLLERGSGQLVGQRVPALHLLAFVFQAVNPVLQGVALWLTAKRHAPCVTQTKEPFRWETGSVTVLLIRINDLTCLKGSYCRQTEGLGEPIKVPHSTL